MIWCVFAEELFSLGPDELGCLEDKEKPGAKVGALTLLVTIEVVSLCFMLKFFLPSSPQVRVIPLELQRLFASLLLSDQQSASTANLTDSFGWNSSEVSVHYLCQ